MRKLANVFLFDFHDRIRDLPGSTAARKFVVETGLRYLRRLEGDGRNDRALMHELANAYRKISSVQGDPAHGNLGDDFIRAKMGTRRQDHGDAVIPKLQEMIASPSRDQFLDDLRG